MTNVTDKTQRGKGSHTRYPFSDSASGPRSAALCCYYTMLGLKRWHEVKLCPLTSCQLFLAIEHLLSTFMLLPTLRVAIPLDLSTRRPLTPMSMGEFFPPPSSLPSPTRASWPPTSCQPARPWSGPSLAITKSLLLWQLEEDIILLLSLTSISQLTQPRGPLPSDSRSNSL